VAGAAGPVEGASGAWWRPGRPARAGARSAAARLAGLAAVLAAAVAGGGCSCGDGAGSGDAGAGEDGGVLRDAEARSDAVAPLIWIDFSATGCDEAPPDGLLGGDAGPADAGPADGGAGMARCSGDAPLRLAFFPVAPAEVDQHEWNFGDGSEPDRRQSPEHVYTDPGIYDVSLFGQGPGGTAAVTKTGFVVVGPGRIGAACSADAQCASGQCVCGAEPCDGLASGFCSAPCASGSACAEGVCADLAPGSPPSPAAWQAELCLADCAGGAPCPAGQICRELRGGDGGWVLGCFAAGLLGDIGDPCADANGELDDSLCASGRCLAEGLRGMCSASCAAEACPASAACATFNGGSPAPSCLARCDLDTACDGDPWLACQSAGGAGAQGFTVGEEPSPAGYCAPAPCDSPDDCPLGQCQSGFCTR
jgi:PKD repeat protein